MHPPYPAITLAVTRLCCERGYRTLFGNLSFSLEAGSGLYLTGENGVGKSTLLRALCGLFQPLSGEVSWTLDGQPVDLHSLPVSYLGHKSGLSLELTPSQNLAFLCAMDRGQPDMAPAAALERMQLGHAADIPCHQLSAGQLRRVALARLLACGTPAWLLDEPATALDTDGQNLVDTMVAEQLERGGVVIMTSHQSLGATSAMSRLTLDHPRPDVTGAEST